MHYRTKFSNRTRTPDFLNVLWRLKFELVVMLISFSDSFQRRGHQMEPTMKMITYLFCVWKFRNKIRSRRGREHLPIQQLSEALLGLSTIQKNKQSIPTKARFIVIFLHFRQKGNKTAEFPHRVTTFRKAISWLKTDYYYAFKRICFVPFIKREPTASPGSFFATFGQSFSCLPKRIKFYMTRRKWLPSALVQKWK